MSSVKLPIFSSVVVYDSNNEVGGEKYHVAHFNDSVVDVIYLICLWTHRSTLIYHPMIV